SVWMFSDGTLAAGTAVRFWPSGNQMFWVESKRLAKMFVSPPGRLSLGSYHETHGTVRLAPAKSIEGASASLARSMFSDGPRGFHPPPANRRTELCWLALCFCSNVAHGTLIPPVSEPPTTSDTPASW